MNQADHQYWLLGRWGIGRDEAEEQGRCQVAKDVVAVL